MTDQPTPASPRSPEPEPGSYAAPPSGAPAAAPASIEPTPPAGPWEPSQPQPKPASKWRVAIPLLVIGAFLAFVLYSVRDQQSVEDLSAGTCFDVPAADSVSTITKVACDQAHDAEIFHNADFTEDASSYPITLTFDRFAGEACTPAFETYTGESADDTDLTIGYFYPSRDSWGDGDREVTCYAGRGDGTKLTQSVKAGT
jgi:hypothetical protein